MVKDINKCGDFKQQQSRSLTTKHGEMGIPPNFGMESTIQLCKPGYLKWVICHWVGLKNHCRNLPKYKWSRVSTTKKRVSCRFSRLDLLGLQSGRKRAETTESPWKVLEKSLKSPWKVLEKSLKSPWKDLEETLKTLKRPHTEWTGVVVFSLLFGWIQYSFSGPSSLGMERRCCEAREGAHGLRRL